MSISADFDSHLKTALHEKARDIVVQHCDPNSGTEAVHYSDLGLITALFDENGFKALRATNCHYMNDKGELLFGLKAFERIFNVEFLNENQVNRQVIQDVLREIIDQPVSEDLKNDNFFVLCLSGSEDDIGQWRGYGDFCKGVSLKFDIDQLMGDNTSISCFRGKVIYSNSEQEILARATIRALLDYLQEGHRFNQESDYDELIKDAARRLISLACLFMKAKKWEAEEEIRIVFWTKGTQDIKVRVRNSSVVPYIEVPASIGYSDANFAVKEIMVGPLSQDELNKSAIRLLLKCRGLNVDSLKVTSSSLTYR